MEIDKSKTYVSTTPYGKIAYHYFVQAQIDRPDENMGVTFRGIWDTGASMSSISKRVADYLRLPIATYIAIGTANGLRNCPVHLLDMRLDGGLLIKRIAVTVSDLPNIDVLLGADIISRGDFAISNFDGQTKLSFRTPSQEDLDFLAVEIHKRQGLRYKKCPFDNSKGRA